jgi:hypothetical protein
MENQHRKITGYRELTQEEIDLMNEIKKKGVELGELISKVESVNVAASDAGDTAPFYSEAYRWCSISKTHLQQGIMALTRAVAKPEFF